MVRSKKSDATDSPPIPVLDQASSPAEGTPLAYRVARGGLWVAAASYFNIGFGFLANLALARLLAPEVFGTFALGMFFFSLLNLRTKLMFGRAFAQRPQTTGELIGTHLALNIAAGLATFALALIAAPILAALGYDRPIIWVMLALATVGISQSLSATAWVAMDKELLFGRVSLVTSVAFPLSYIPALFLAVQGGEYWSLVAQNATYAVLLLFGLWWACRRYLPQVWRMRWRFNGVVAREFIRFGLMLSLAALAGTLTLHFDSFLVGSLVSVEALGFYDRAYRIAQWPFLLLGSVATRTAYYAYAKLQHDEARLKKTVTMTFWLITILALPFTLAIFVSAPDFIRLLYGDRWQPSAVLVRFLVIYSLLRPLLGNANSLFVATGRPERQTVIGIAQAAVLVLAGPLVTSAYGAKGTSITVGVALVVGAMLAYRYLRQTVDLPLKDTFAAPVVSAVVAIAAYAFLMRGVDLDLLGQGARVLVQAGLIAAIFFAAMFAMRPRQLVERANYMWRLLRAS